MPVLCRAQSICMQMPCPESNLAMLTPPYHQEGKAELEKFSHFAALDCQQRAQVLLLHNMQFLLSIMTAAHYDPLSALIPCASFIHRCMPLVLDDSLAQHQILQFQYWK